MIVELKGVGTINKGAYLMLLAILDQFSKEGISVDFVSEPGFGMDYRSMGKLGILQKFNPKYKKLPVAEIVGLLPQSVRRLYGLVLQKEVDVVLDGSGFLYGDSWGSKRISARLGREIKALKKNKAKVILLPQALGPFEKKGTVKAFQPIIDNADLIFCRDEKSLNYVVGAYGERTNVKLAPDFTNLLKIDINLSNSTSDKVCIIPNYKMLSETPAGEKYFKFLHSSIEIIQSKGLQPLFLIHEGKKDIEIAEKVNASLMKSVPIITDADPLQIKEHIKESKFIVVSRFHGLVSALSQGVPAVSTSWSHKYEMLLKDYNSTDTLVKLDNSYSKEVLEELYDNVCDEQYYSDLKSRLELSRKVQENRTREMWQSVFECILK